MAVTRPCVIFVFFVSCTTFHATIHLPCFPFVRFPQSVLVSVTSIRMFSAPFRQSTKWAKSVIYAYWEQYAVRRILDNKIQAKNCINWCVLQLSFGIAESIQGSSNKGRWTNAGIGRKKNKNWCLATPATWLWGSCSRHLFLGFLTIWKAPSDDSQQKLRSRFSRNSTEKPSSAARLLYELQLPRGFPAPWSDALWLHRIVQSNSQICKVPKLCTGVPGHVYTQTYSYNIIYVYISNQ